MAGKARKGVSLCGSNSEGTHSSYSHHFRVLTEPKERVWKVLIKVSVPGLQVTSNYSPASSGSGTDMLTVSSTTVPPPLELSAILSWKSQSYSEMSTVNQLNILAENRQAKPGRLEIDLK